MVAVDAAGAALSVVAMPLTVVGMGVTVDGFPLVSRDTQGFNDESEAIVLLAKLSYSRVVWTGKTYQLGDRLGLRRQMHFPEVQLESVGCFLPFPSTRA